MMLLDFLTAGHLAAAPVPAPATPSPGFFAKYYWLAWFLILIVVAIALGAMSSWLRQNKKAGMALIPGIFAFLFYAAAASVLFAQSWAGFMLDFGRGFCGWISRWDLFNGHGVTAAGIALGIALIIAVVNLAPFGSNKTYGIPAGLFFGLFAIVAAGSFDWLHDTLASFNATLPGVIS